MYKRKLRVWGLYKNSPPATHKRGASTDAQPSGTPRYLVQNTVDESLHTLFDLFTPWITQADLDWKSARRMQCPPRAAFIFDDFTHNIAIAATAFESGDTTRGGMTMRQAFMDLESTLLPNARSVFTLHSLFFALATLNHVGLFKISRLLVAHATRLVALRVQADATDKSDMQNVPELELHEGFEDTPRGEHARHPFPQILKQLRLLSTELEKDGASMANTVFQVWSVYHRVTSTASATYVMSQVSRREFWTAVIKADRTPMVVSNKLREIWMDAIQPVLHYLLRLLDYAEQNMDVDISLLHLDEIVSVYSFLRRNDFEEKALELLATVEKRSGGQISDNKANIVQWGCNASLELAAYYKEKGDFVRTVKYIGHIIPDAAGTAWQTILMDELHRWKREQEKTRMIDSPVVIS